MQTSADVAQLMDAFRRGVSAQFLPDGRMRVGDRVVTIAGIPVGIDAKDFHRSEHAVVKDRRDELIRIIGVDRLDYTKGLPQKFRGFGRFIEKYPAYRTRVVLNQIAAPSRESVEAYADIRRELESLCGAINGSYGDLDWVPIHYINRTEARERLADIYFNSEICLVTPLQDGMNLVAKEFVSAQDPLDPGVLILSRFAGAAEQLTEALIVNPYDIDAIAVAIRQAAEMSIDERRKRHQALSTTVELASASAWSNRFLELLTEAHSAGNEPQVSNTRLQSAIARLSDAPDGPASRSHRGPARPINSAVKPKAAGASL